MSLNTTPAAAPVAPTNAAPRAPYVAPTLEPLGSWSALTMQGTVGGGFIAPSPSIVRKIVSPHD